MQKLKLIDALKKECRISKKEAAAIVDLFFESMSEALARGDRLKFADYVLSMLKNTSPTKAEIPKPAKAFK